MHSSKVSLMEDMTGIVIIDMLLDLLVLSFLLDHNRSSSTQTLLLNAIGSGTNS